MDAATYAAAGATQFADAAQAQQWFDGIAYEVATLDVDATWDDAAGRLRDIAGSSGLDWAAEALIAHLEQESDPTAILRELGDRENEETYVAAALQGSADAATGDAATGTGAEFDDAAWAEYLTSMQGSWDGAEESWDAFRSYFVQSAGPGLEGAAEALATHAESSGDKRAALAPYGIVAASAAEAAGQPADPDAAAPVDPDAAAPVDPDEADAAVAALDIQDDTIAEVLQEHPEFAALGADALEELMAEVLAEFETEEEAS